MTNSSIMVSVEACCYVRNKLAHRQSSITVLLPLKLERAGTKVPRTPLFLNFYKLFFFKLHFSQVTRQPVTLLKTGFNPLMHVPKLSDTL